MQVKADMVSKDKLLQNLLAKRFQDETGEEALRALNERILLMEEKMKISDELIDQLVVQVIS